MPGQLFLANCQHSGLNVLGPVLQCAGQTMISPENCVVYPVVAMSC